MNTAQIISLQNADDPRLRVYADLRHRSAGADQEHFVAEGRLVVGRLIESDYEVESLLVEAGVEGEFAARVGPDVPIYVLPSETIRDLVGFDFHRGIIACGKRKRIEPIENWIGDDAKLSLAALCVTEAANLGSMLRTAAAFGIDRVLLGPGAHDPFSRRVIRTSMATVFKHRFFRLDDPAESLRALATDQAIRTVATTLASDADPLQTFVPDDRRTLLLLGNEARGLPSEVQAAATDRVTIPMSLGIDSLNVAVAAALFMYELSSRMRPTLSR